MICKAQIRRRFPTRDDAHRYLAARGFLFLPQGWANGRWIASLDQDASGFALTIDLRLGIYPKIRGAILLWELRKPCAKAQEASRDLS